MSPDDFQIGRFEGGGVLSELQGSLNFHQNTHLRFQKYRPSFSQNTPLYFENAPLYFQNTPLYFQEILDTIVNFFSIIFFTNLLRKSKYTPVFWVPSCILKIHPCTFKIHPCILKIHPCTFKIHPCTFRKYAPVFLRIHPCIFQKLLRFVKIHPCILKIHPCILRNVHFLPQRSVYYERLASLRVFSRNFAFSYFIFSLLKNFPL